MTDFSCNREVLFLQTHVKLVTVYLGGFSVSWAPDQCQAGGNAS